MPKRFVISDESVNEFGFWLSTAGGDLSQFEKNPIMLWMHNRAFRGTKDEVLPLGHWENIKVENGQITADAVFDADEFSQSISAKVESGTIRMASAAIRPIDQSEDVSLLKPGQTRATVTKWQLLEASVCDIGANFNALVLYDENDNLVKLSDDIKDLKFPNILKTKSDTKMKKVIKLFSDLTEDATEDQLAAKVSELQSANKVLVDKIDGFETQQKLALKKETATLVDSAVKDGRIDAASKDHFTKLFEKDHETAKATLASMKPHVKVADKLASGVETKDDTAKMTWDQLDKSGKLAELRSKNLDLYKEKFAAKFGHDPKNV